MAIFQPGLLRGGGTVEDSRMTIVDHLGALRQVLIVSFAALAVGTAVAFLFWSRVLSFLIHQGGVGHLYYTAPAGAFTLALKISIYLGFVIASPVIIQQVLWFVSPGLHRHEKKLILPLLGSTILFFLLGIVFAMGMLPTFLKVLSGFAPENLRFLPFVDEYVSFVLVLVVGFGIVFELPVVIYTLGRIGIISSKWLYANRLYWACGLGVLAAVGTPGADPITPLFMFVPLYVFYEGTALLLKLTGR